MAQIVSIIIGREVQTAAVTDEGYTQVLVKEDLPQEVAQFFALIQRDIRNGSLDYPSTDLENALGRQPSSFDSFINTL